MKNLNKKLVILLIFFSGSLITTNSLMFTNTLNISTDSNLEMDNPNSINTADDFDILDYWEGEMSRVEAVDVNIAYGDTGSFEYTNPDTREHFEFDYSEIYFDSPNWVNDPDTIIRIHGLLMYPENIGSSNPGCLAMHGWDQQADIPTIRTIAAHYLEMGFMVLCYDAPGCGESEGIIPPEGVYFTGVFNEESYTYLTICAAIQGLRVLESITIIDNSKIMVTGASFGAFNAMWLSSICGDRIAGVISLSALGDFAENLNHPDKEGYNDLILLPPSYWNNEMLYLDPIYYLKSPNLPSILWIFGTNDEYFHYDCLEGTYNAVIHDNKYVRINPNGHHLILRNIGDTVKFFIDSVLNPYPDPPEIELISVTKEYFLFFNRMTFEVEIDSGTAIDSVEIHFAYNEKMWWFKSLTHSGGNTWTCFINSIKSEDKIDFLFDLELDYAENPLFSSVMYAEEY